MYIYLLTCSVLCPCFGNTFPVFPKNHKLCVAANAGRKAVEFKMQISVVLSIVQVCGLNAIIYSFLIKNIKK